jgi:hypothetical protein
MTATNEQIEDEAHRRFDENPCTPLAHYIIEVTREGWTPPKPVVDPDVLAYREWAASYEPGQSMRARTLAGQCDDGPPYYAYLAGARMATERERERAKVLKEALRDALPRLENCFTHHGWHTERPPEPDHIVNIRNLLKEADQ